MGVVKPIQVGIDAGACALRLAPPDLAREALPRPENALQNHRTLASMIGVVLSNPHGCFEASCSNLCSVLPSCLHTHHCEEINFSAARKVCGNDENFLKSSQRKKVFGKAPFLGHNRPMSLSGLWIGVFPKPFRRNEILMERVPFRRLSTGFP